MMLQSNGPQVNNRPSDSNQYEENGVEHTGDPIEAAHHTEQSKQFSDLRGTLHGRNSLNNLKDLINTDYVVRQSLIDDNWKIVESRRSRLISTLPAYAVKSLFPPTLKQTRISEEASAINNASAVERTNRERIIGQQRNAFEFEFSAKSMDRDPIKEGDLNQKLQRNHHDLVTAENGINKRVNDDYDNVDNYDDDDEDDDEALMKFTLQKRRGVPLPDFGDLNSDDENNHPNALNGSYSSPWSLGSKGASSLGVYENLLVKKPLFMFIPESLGNETAKVGELELDQLSDLSENEPNSQVSSYIKSESDEEIVVPVLARTDSSVQTDGPIVSAKTKESGTMTGADIIAEIVANRSKLSQLGPSSVSLLTKSTEGSEVDPKFSRRPSPYIEVLEGEAINLTCKLSGTAPMDVFWFRDMDEVTQMEEDERCELGHHGDNFSLDLYDTTGKDSGKYLCIGVNSQGHCVQQFEVRVQDNQKSRIPVSFSAIPENLDVTARSEATLKCKVAGYPPPRVEWYCRGQRLKSDNNFNMEINRNGIHQLVIYDVGETSSEYTVVAHNIDGKVKASARINVKPKQIDKISVSSSVGSNPYPDVDELVQIAEKISHTPNGSVTKKRTSWLMRNVSKDSEDNASKTETIPAKMTRVARESSKTADAREIDDQEKRSLAYENKDADDSEEELKISYQDFERLFNARLVSRLQLTSGRVRKRDLEKINAFLKNKATTQEEQKSPFDDLPLRVNCGLKQIDPSFYRRDYFVKTDGSESNQNRYQPKTSSVLRINSAPTGDSNLRSTEYKPSQSYGNLFDSKEAEVRNLEFDTKKIAAETKENGILDSSAEEKISDNDSAADDDVTLPSVKQLLVKFGGAPLSPEASKDDTSPLKRIYSLTGRSVPEFVRERIQKHISITDSHIKSNDDEFVRDDDDKTHQTPTEANKDFTNQSTLIQQHETDTTQAKRSPSSLNKNEQQVEIKGDGVPIIKGTFTQRSASEASGDSDIKALNSLVRQRATYWQNLVQRKHSSEELPDDVFF